MKDYDLKKIKNFVDKLGIIRINHLGMGYSVDNFNTETKKIRNKLNLIYIKIKHLKNIKRIKKDGYLQVIHIPRIFQEYLKLYW